MNKNIHEELLHLGRSYAERAYYAQATDEGFKCAGGAAASSHALNANDETLSRLLWAVQALTRGSPPHSSLPAVYHAEQVLVYSRAIALRAIAGAVPPPQAD